VPMHYRTVTLVALAIGLTRCVSANAEILLNAEGETYDSHPALAVLEDGTSWCAWHAYYRGRDRVFARWIDAAGGVGPLHVVSEQGTVHGPPSVVHSQNATWVIWSAKVGRRWRVLTRRIVAGAWSPTVRLSPESSDAIWPTAAAMGNGALIVAWSELEKQTFRIWCRVHEAGAWQSPQALSAFPNDAHRPVLATNADGAAWIFWDQYDGKTYSVLGRPLRPKPGPIEFVSPEQRHCLQATALFTKQGLCVAWLRKVDVKGRPGVISQWHTLEVAVRRNDAWQMVADANRNETAAELTHGLMAKIQPAPLATGGYLGRRTRAMLLEGGGSVWLLWERKADHRGGTPNVTGELIGRPMRAGQWKEAAVLHRGKLDYHLAHPRAAVDGKFALLASALPRHNRRIYQRLIGDLRDTAPFRQDVWTGWQAVDLPMENELTERHSIRAGGKTYQLYWADMHCHSGLTADAEGEPDELTHYARDRAALDVVVFTENDFIYDVPLTMYEYALGNFFAAVYSHNDRFISLPGYEWTSRIPGVATAPLEDLGNWTPPYKNRSYPNHRSVIYPPPGGPLVHYPEVGNRIADLNQAVGKSGGITLTQHPTFKITGHEVEVGMEVTSGWSSYLSKWPDSFHEPLNRGVRLAFVANGDSHRRAPGLSGGLTGIYAERLTATAIIDALRQRRCYATNGSRVFIDSRANGVLMGQVADAAEGAVTLTLNAIGTRPIVSASLYRDGSKVKRFEANGRREISLTFADTGLTKGTHWYYWRVAQERAAPDLPGNMMVAHGHLAWSSPVWVQVE
ncbi:MAG: DUF3604 domain-containing protein, partial [Pirellulaceae bacterium]